jgi:hypothetical protein
MQGPIAIAVLSALGLFASGCGVSASMRAAEKGDLVALRAAIAAERARCTLEPDDVRKIAKKTAERELTRSDAAAALLRIDEARACVRPLEGTLDSLAGAPGDVGASATLALLEDGGGDKNGERQLREHGASPNPLWRAVAARAAVGAELGPARRTFYTDADERVRLAAFRAALERGDRADRAALVEAARLDPNSLGRALASRALGAIADAEVVLGLRDLYARADEGLRQSIVDAWGQSAAASEGGMRELFRVAENERGAPSIEAGWILLRFTQIDTAPAAGTWVLLRGIDEGLVRDRTLAIAHAPLADARIVDALRKAATSTEPTVKTAALARLLESHATRDEAMRALDAMSKAGSREALYTLARAGDGAAARAVAKDLAAADAETRLAAGRVLIGGGALDRAADLLADADPHVRMTAACAVLASVPRD